LGATVPRPAAKIDWRHQTPQGVKMSANGAGAGSVLLFITGNDLLRNPDGLGW
jgi:hypothetical protein